MGLKAFEKKLESAVEGTFSRVFRSGVRPVEIGRRVNREMDDGRTVDVRGRTLVPNDFIVALCNEDLEQFAEVQEPLCRELVDSAREHARSEGYHLMGPMSVALVEDAGLRRGTYRIDARLKQGEPGSGGGSLLLPDGRVVALGPEPITLGRLTECDITIADPNVSRTHAEIRPYEYTYVLFDLGSMNGTKVNGQRISEHTLSDGDRMEFGGTTLVYQETM